MGHGCGPRSKSMSEDESFELQDEIIVHSQYKPYINREINFKLFQDILMERRDKARVYITFNEFM